LKQRYKISRGIKSHIVFGSLFNQYWCVATKSGDFLADRTRTGKAETWQQLNLTKCLALTNIELNNALDSVEITLMVGGSGGICNMRVRAEN